MSSTPHLARLRAALPAGATLPEAAWERRHRWLVMCLWAHVFALPVYAMLQGFPPGHSALEALPVLVPALLAQRRTWFTRRGRSAIVALGLLTASAVTVHTSHGVTEAHFHFFVMVVLLSMYEDWLPFLLAVGYVVLHHGIGGALAPHDIFDAHQSESPWKWAGIHGAFILAAAAGSMLAWRLNEEVRAESKRNEDRFRHTFEDAPVGMTVTDDGGIWLEVNASLCEMTGYTRDELVGGSFGRITHPDDRDTGREDLRRLISGEADSIRREKRYIHKEGREITVALRVSRSLDGASGGGRLIAQMEDITERKQREAGARRHRVQQAHIVALGQRALSGDPLENLFADAVRRAADGIGVTHSRILRLHDDDGGTPALQQIAEVGWVPGSSVGLTALAAPRILELLKDGPLSGTYADEPSGDVDVSEFRALGLCSGASVVIAQDDHEPFGILTVQSTARREFDDDDTAFMQAVANVLASAVHREQAQDELRHQSLHDPLVGLPNRALLLDRLERALARSQRTGNLLAVMFLDLDQFKVVNDSLGHQIGDLLLQGLVPRLGACLRANDTLARFGGDEFVVLCEDLEDTAEALTIAERLRAAFSTPAQIGEQHHYITASIGVAVSNSRYYGRAEALIRDADAAMYRAKDAGRNRTELFDDVMRSRIVHRLDTESGLRTALETGALLLHYQPIVSLADGSTDHHEALVRWEHPVRGLLSPDEFIPVAEESGLIIPLGEWVLDEACRQAAQWGGGRTVAINLSAIQVAQPGLPGIIATALRRHDLDPSHLICEITETALIEDPDGAALTLRALSRLGVRIALDDFGTGYSSLSSLKHFPLDAIKLDRSFIRDLAPGTPDAAIIGSLVDMARALRIGTVAEGIETEDQRILLRDMGCDLGQGYLFSRPVPAAEALGVRA